MVQAIQSSNIEQPKKTNVRVYVCVCVELCMQVFVSVNTPSLNLPAGDGPSILTLIHKFLSLTI
jgi:hypothetical protein